MEGQESDVLPSCSSQETVDTPPRKPSIWATESTPKCDAKSLRRRTHVLPDMAGKPRKVPIYAAAKAAEEAGNLPRALNLYKQAVENGEKVESAVKDAAGILHVLGRSGEALEMLQKHARQFGSRKSYKNLQESLNKLWEPEKQPAADYTRTIEFTILGQERLTWDLCALVFRNSARIRRIIACGTSCSNGFVEFATVSAARKALAQSTGSELLLCRWARPECQVSLLDSFFGSLSHARKDSRSVELWPDGCCSAADIDVFHLLPLNLWQALNVAWPSPPEVDDKQISRHGRRLLLLCEAIP